MLSLLLKMHSDYWIWQKGQTPISINVKTFNGILFQVLVGRTLKV